MFSLERLDWSFPRQVAARGSEPWDMDILRYMDLGGTFRIFFSFFTWSTCLRRMTSWRLRILISYLDKPIIIIHCYHLLENYYHFFIYFEKANYYYLLRPPEDLEGKKVLWRFVPAEAHPGKCSWDNWDFLEYLYRLLLVHLRLYYYFFYYFWNAWAWIS